MASDTRTTPIQNMGVNHGGFNIRFNSVSIFLLLNRRFE